ncbi:DUF2922 domain-containing protein [Bacillus sp. N9]
MKTLELIFESEQGKTATISIDHPQDPVDLETVKTSMESIIASGVFIDSDGYIYEAIKSARLVERNVTIFEMNE